MFTSLKSCSREGSRGTRSGFVHVGGLGAVTSPIVIDLSMMGDNVADEILWIRRVERMNGRRVKIAAALNDVIIFAYEYNMKNFF